MLHHWLTQRLTDLEDELPTPEDSPFVSDSSSEGVRLLGVRPAPPDVIDLKLEKALLSVSMLPVMVTPIVDPVVGFPGTPSSYPEPPLPVMPNDDPDPMSQISPLREAADSPILDVFPSYLISPTCSVYEPVTSPITPSLREDDDYRPPSSPATMDQYLSREGDLLLGDPTDLPLLAMPLTPHPTWRRWFWDRPRVPRPGIPSLCPQMGCRTCLGRAPLMYSGWCWTVCRAVSIV